LGSGYDADVVVWDSHPLSIGATPVQVYIDGIEQLKNPHALSKPNHLQSVPNTPNWDKEANATVNNNGLPPLRGQRTELGARSRIRFVGLKNVWINDQDGHVHTLYDEDDKKRADVSVVVAEGSVQFCAKDESAGACGDSHAKVIDLHGGSIAPGLTALSSSLGLLEIAQEPSTGDGPAPDPLSGGRLPSENTIIRAVDGLAFEGRNTL
jgi:hypothetical protein